MAGGTFNKLVGKDRPGTYINFESTRTDLINISERGIVLLPLAEHDYGPAGEFIVLDNSSPDAQIAKLGYSVFENHPNMLLIREAFKRARRVIVYIPRQGARASATDKNLRARARYGGERGNALQFSVVPNPLGGFDVTVYRDSIEMAVYEHLETIEDLIEQNDNWIEFSLTGAQTEGTPKPTPLEEVAGLKLEGGTNGVLVVSDITKFLDKAETVRWNTLAFPFEATGEKDDPIPGLQEAVLVKIRYLREDTGKYRKAVMPNFKANYEGIINVTNSVVLNGGIALSLEQVTAWVAGADSGASNVQSNTYVPYIGAIDIVGPKNHSEAVQAIRNGEFFFSFSEEGEVIVEYDINSLTTFRFPKDKTWRKNRVLRVMDTFAESLMLNFPPNRFDNAPVGWDIMEGLGRAILMIFYDVGAIKHVDYDKDFLVDRIASTGDEVYFNIGLEPVDSAEKLFFTIKTR